MSGEGLYLSCAAFRSCALVPLVRDASLSPLPAWWIPSRPIPGPKIPVCGCVVEVAQPSPCLADESRASVADARVVLWLGTGRTALPVVKPYQTAVLLTQGVLEGIAPAPRDVVGATPLLLTPSGIPPASPAGREDERAADVWHAAFTPNKFRAITRGEPSHQP